jgi:hypothetical protein
LRPGRIPHQAGRRHGVGALDASLKVHDQDPHRGAIEEVPEAFDVLLEIGGVFAQCPLWAKGPRKLSGEGGGSMGKRIDPCGC